MDKYTTAFAEYMGFEIVRIGYFGANKKDYGIDAETKWQKENKEWIENSEIFEVGQYAVNVKENIFHPLYDLNYTTSWDWLLPVWKKASTEIFGKAHLLSKCMATIFDVNIEKTVENLYKLIKSQE